MNQYQGSPTKTPCATANPRQFKSGQPSSDGDFSGVPFTSLVDGVLIETMSGETVSLSKGDVVWCRGAGEQPPGDTIPIVDSANNTPVFHYPRNDQDPPRPGFGVGPYADRWFDGVDELTGIPTEGTAPDNGKPAWQSLNAPTAAQLALRAVARNYVIGRVTNAQLEQAAKDFVASISGS